MLEQETRRLRLIPLTLDLKRIALRAKEELGVLLGVKVPASWPGQDYAEALPFFIAEMERNPSGSAWDGVIIHKADRAIIGEMGFKGGPDSAGRVEIGYSIVPEYRNQGYATEMAHHLIAWAFQQSDVAIVNAECFSDNAGSIRVLEKVGMHRLGCEENILHWELRRDEYSL